MNQGTESLVPSTTIAPTGASKAHRLTPLALTKLPIAHCSTKGVKRNSESCMTQNGFSFLVLR
jgi:hypothetical protein